MFTHLDFYNLIFFSSHSCRVYVIKEPSKCVLNESKNPNMEIDLVNFKLPDHNRATAFYIKLSLEKL